MIFRVIAITVFTFLFTTAMLSLAGVHKSLAPAREWAATQLIDVAWNRTVREGHAVQPWPGIASYPVAKITVPALGEELVVMSGVSNTVLKHTAGWNEGTDAPGMPGISLISGYRNGAFSFIGHLDSGTDFKLETASGTVKNYRVEGVSVIQGTEMRVPMAEDESVILFSTSYPVKNGDGTDRIQLVIIGREMKPGLTI